MGRKIIVHICVIKKWGGGTYDLHIHDMYANLATMQLYIQV